MHRRESLNRYIVIPVVFRLAPYAWMDIYIISTDKVVSWEAFSSTLHEIIGGRLSRFQFELIDSNGAADSEKK